MVGDDRIDAQRFDLVDRPAAQVGEDDQPLSGFVRDVRQDVFVQLFYEPYIVRFPGPLQRQAGDPGRRQTVGIYVRDYQALAAPAHLFRALLRRLAESFHR